MSNTGRVFAKYYVTLGGAIGDVGETKYGFRAPDDAYDSILKDLGVVKLDQKKAAKGVLFGANYPKPPRVKINAYHANLGGGSTNDVKQTARRFCDPDKLGRVLADQLKGKTVTISGKAYRIESVSI